MKSISRDRMMQLIKKEYPKAWMEKSEKWGKGLDEFEGFIIMSAEENPYTWIAPEGDFEIDLPLFDNYEGLYAATDGVEPNLDKLLTKNGWYVEWYDSGTVMILPN